MAELKCEFPEGCMLDLWAQVIKAKFCENRLKYWIQSSVYRMSKLGERFVPLKTSIKVIQAHEDLSCYNKVKIFIEFEVILFVIVGNEYQIITVTDCYSQVIERMNSIRHSV